MEQEVTDGKKESQLRTWPRPPPPAKEVIGMPPGNVKMC